MALGNGQSYLCVQFPDEVMMKHLEIEKDVPVVFVHHISCLKNGLPFEYVDTYTIWNQFSLDFYNKRVY